jgi:nitrate/TMAO reductase-like tetraheme cytochrome c subunit
VSETKIVGAGDLLDKERMVKYIIRKHKVSREKAKEVFEIIKNKENKRIPNFQKMAEEIWSKEEK